MIRLCLRHTGLDGQRISKTVGDPLNGGYKEYYLRDAQGNIMATYKYANNGTSLKVTDRPVYGSRRIGSFTRQVELMGEPAMHQWPYTQPMQAPLKRYEITDHLGNVAAVVTGRLLPGNGSGASKQAELVSAQGYEPFGSLLPGRNYSSDSYRFGWNGKENNNEVHNATGTSVDFGERMLDTRVGRWLSLDPKSSKYPHSSPYAAMGGNPLLFIDEQGEDIVVYLVYSDGTRAKEPLIRIVSDEFTHDVDIQTQVHNMEFKQYGDPLLVNPFPSPIPTLEYDLRPFEQAMSADAYMINADLGFAFGGGAAVGLSAVLINKGDDQGFHFYRSVGGRFGLDGGVGIAGGDVNFNEDNSANARLNRETFLGWDQGVNIGVGDAAITTVNSYVDGNICVPFISGSCEPLYDATLVGGGLGPTKAGASYYFSQSTYLGSWNPLPAEPQPAATTTDSK